MMQLSDSMRARFDREVAKYPADQRQSAVMACLSIVQQEQGYVSAEAEEAIAAHLGMPPIAVHEVTTFYNMYNQQPVGAYKLNVCTNLPCQLRGGTRRWTTCATSWACSPTAPRLTAPSPCSPVNAWGPAPMRPSCW